MVNEEKKPKTKKESKIDWNLQDVKDIFEAIKNEGPVKGILGKGVGRAYGKLVDAIPYSEHLPDAYKDIEKNWEQFADSLPGSRAEQVAYFMKLHVGKKADNFLKCNYGFAQAELDKLQKDVDMYKWAFDLTYLTPEKDKLGKLEEFFKNKEVYGKIKPSDQLGDGSNWAGQSKNGSQNRVNLNNQLGDGSNISGSQPTSSMSADEYSKVLGTIIENPETMKYLGKGAQYVGEKAGDMLKAA